MSDETDGGGDYMDVEDVPDDALILQCGAVIDDEEGKVGQVDIQEFENPELIDEGDNS